MANEITENDRMLMFLNSLTDFNVHVKLFQMKEQVKVFGLASEIFEDALEPFLPKILGSLTKLIKEEATNRLHQTIADTLGLITANILDKIETTEE